MFYRFIFSYIEWDPNRFIFTIPYIERPIAWYGLLFVIGFAVGYFLMLSMFKRMLNLTPITKTHISNWQKLNNKIQKISNTPSHNLYFAFKNFSFSQKISPTYQEKILKTLNFILKKNDRTFLEPFFKDALLSTEDITTKLVDRLTVYMVLGTIIGARLGYIFFYDFNYYLNHPLDIFKTWQGGLASHGGAIGVIFALFLYFRFAKRFISSLTFLNLMDLLAVPTAFVAFCIRIGNFINQEIVGIPTTVPWAIVFKHPADAYHVVARHPVQLYEAFSYLLIFIILFSLWYFNHSEKRKGFLSGLFFLGIFSSRFIIEFWKVPQGAFDQYSFVKMGQLLSIPFIILGAILLFYSYKKIKNKI